MATEALEGITERSTKAEIIKRLRSVAKKLGAYEDERLARMQEIEEKVRQNAQPLSLKKVIISSTPEEWAEAVDFLDNFEGYLPAVLARVLEGAKEAAPRT